METDDGSRRRTGSLKEGVESEGQALSLGMLL